MKNEELKQEAYATHFEHLADLKNSIDKEIGLSPWIEITQEKIDSFAHTTEDLQWIHVDQEMSEKHSPYRKTIAHGFLVLSFASKFVYDTCTVGDVVMGVNYGLNKVRFPSATLSGSLLRGRVSLIQYDEKANGARYIIKIIFEVKGQEKPACVAEFIAQAYTTG
jgi:acyl dehydratase